MDIDIIRSSKYENKMSKLYLITIRIKFIRNKE